ncbi:MAG: MFS transporter [Mycetocola sp.]
MSTRPSPTQAPTRLREAWIALTGLSAVFLFEMLDNSVLNVALPTIGRELHTSTLELQWVTGAYSVAFGALMLLFGAVADRFGRRRMMLVGLVLLGLASLATVVVTTAGALIAVRAVMGIAAAMTTPGSMALAFRLFEDQGLRIRAMTVISTAGLVGLAIGPTAGGFVLAVAPWQALLLINVPIAVLALVSIRVGVPVDRVEDLHPDRIDIAGAVLGTATLVGALVTPTLFVEMGGTSWEAWAGLGGTLLVAALFVWRERTATQPMLDLRLLARPLVASGLAYKAASGLAVSGLSYMTTLQLQFVWGWPPSLAAIAILPQVIVLLASGRFVGPLVQRLGLTRAAWASAAAVVVGLAVFAVGSRAGYAWVFVALVLVAAGMRVVGVVAGNNVLQGLPSNRTSIGSALVDTSSEVANGIGIAVIGTVLAALVSGSIATASATPEQLSQLQDGITAAGVILTVISALLVGVGIRRSQPHRETA